MNKGILIIGIFWLTSSSLNSQTISENARNYEDFCFCEVGLSHPKVILDLDNNLDILIALKTTNTLHGLDDLKIDYTLSQINLLELSGLIEKKDSVYKTIIPILSKDETSKLRSETKRMAENIIPLFKSDFENFSETLNLHGLQDNSYSLFFALILDGLVWDILEQKNEIDSFDITNEKPFWAGTFWMVEPRRDFSCGTNSLSSGDFTINVNWSDKAIIDVSSYKMLRELLNDYRMNGRITKPEVVREFAKNDLFTKDGTLHIPVIRADSSDIIYVQSMTIAKKVAGYLSNRIDYSTILTGCPDLTNGQKITILYHEIMWDILDRMEEDKQLNKPVAFGNPQKAKDEDLRDLIFILED
jgi:hypothetical protein